MNANGVQLVVAGHKHCFRYDPPSGDRKWAQVVGGGPDLDRRKVERFPTVIEGKVVGGKLVVKAHNVLSGGVAGEFVFERRA